MFVLRMDRRWCPAAAATTAQDPMGWMDRLGDYCGLLDRMVRFLLFNSKIVECVGVGVPLFFDGEFLSHSLTH